MSATPEARPTLMTANEFMAGPGQHCRYDLVAGRVVVGPAGLVRRGIVVGAAARAIGGHVDAVGSGRVMIGTHVHLKRNPDTLRAAAVSYVGYTHLPRGPFPDGVMPPPFELVVEVRSPSATWADEVRKCFEYLDAGVQVAALLDNDSQTVSVFRTNVVQETFHAADTLTLPDVLPGFAVPVARLFKV